MPVNVIGTIKPKNGLSFPVVEAIDVFVENYENLADAISHFATDAMIEAINTVLSGKANTSVVNTAVANLQGQIDQIVISASAESVVAPEVAAARVGYDGKSYQTLKSRLDSESEQTAEEISSILDMSEVEYTSTTGYYISPYGTKAQNENYAYTAPIELKKNEEIRFTAAGNSTNVSMISKCNSDGTGIVPKVLSNGSDVSRYSYIATENQFVILSFNATKSNSANIVGENSPRVVSLKCNAISNEVDELRSVIMSPSTVFDFSDSSTYISGKYISSTGDISASDGFAYSEPIDISVGTIISFYARGYYQNVAIISKYNNGTYSPVVISVDSTAQTYTYTADSDCKIVLCSSRSINPAATITPPDKISELAARTDKNTEDIQELESRITPGIDLTFLFQNMAGIGDSLMSGEIYDDANNYHKDCYSFSWLAMLSKYNKANYFCYSQGGLTTKSWLESHWKTDFEALVDLPDVVFIALGTNDKNYTQTIPTGTASDSSSTETFCGYYKKIIELVHTVAPNAKIMCCSLYSIIGTSQTYCDLIEDISGQYSYCYFIDIVSNTDIRPSPDSMYAENYHYNTLGYRMIADVVHKLLNDSITDNLADYKYFGLYND